MSATRRIQRAMRRHAGDKPSARWDAARRVHPIVDKLVTDAELARAKYRPPLDMQRSRAKAREWDERIERRLAVPEHVRMQFAKGTEAGP